MNIDNSESLAKLATLAILALPACMSASFFLFQRAPFSRFIRVEIDVILVCATNPFPVNIENPESLAKVAIFSARSACMRVHPVVVNVCTQVIFPGRELLYYSVQVING